MVHFDKFFRDTGNFLNTFTGWTDGHDVPNNAAATLASPNLLNPSTYTYLCIIGAKLKNCLSSF